MTAQTQQTIIPHRDTAGMSCNNLLTIQHKQFCSGCEIADLNGLTKPVAADSYF